MMTETTLDVLGAVLECPVLRKGAEVNEIGEDCEGCKAADPDRAETCRELQTKGEVWIDPYLGVRAVRPGELKYPWEGRRFNAKSRG